MSVKSFWITVSLSGGEDVTFCNGVIVFYTLNALRAFSEVC